MAWKILVGISLPLLIAAGAFSWFLKSAIVNERQLRDDAKKNNELTIQRQKEGLKEKEADNLKITDKTKDLDGLTKNVADQKPVLDATNAQISDVSDKLKASEAEVNDLQKKVGDVAQIQEKMKQVEDLTKSVTGTELAKNTEQGKLDALKNEKAKRDKQIVDMHDLEARQKRGVIDPKFEAHIAAVYPSFGFCVINKGEIGGVYINSDLDIQRGKTIVGKLKVTGVETTTSVADYTGVTPRVGDLIIAGETSRQVAKADAATTPVEGTTPAAGAAPAAGADAFGAPAAPAVPAAPAGPVDPFAPATPAAAPAAPAAPPPGGSDAAPASPGMAPAAPGAPATPDPFAPKKP